MPAESSYEQILEYFDDDQGIIDEIAKTIGFSKEDFKTEAEYRSKITYSFNSEIGAVCSETGCIISSTLIWQAALLVVDHYPTNHIHSTTN